MPSIILLCRPGFEKECAAEITAHAAQHEFAGFSRTRENTGWVEFVLDESIDAKELVQNFDARRLAFARQAFVSFTSINNLPERDKLAPITATLAELLGACDFSGQVSQVLAEAPDTSDTEGLTAFLTSFSKPLENYLKKNMQIPAEKGALRLHVFFLNYSLVHLGFSHINKSSSRPCGIPRLRFPKEAPSRSTLKLEEAFLVLLEAHERAQLLTSGSTAVDLGAAPGGWTWQLVKRSFLVTAIDNANMDKALMESGLVEHLRHDGFSFAPKKPVDWMVCDMVEQPTRIAKLTAEWFRENRCQHAIVNLKLPMKKRYDEVQKCLAIMRDAVPGTTLKVRCKQLYHDRDEVTCFISRL
jgi:23S rRNA (cytidine2498-2'-O)-methyltransferase